MKPLKKGAARTGLETNLSGLVGPQHAVVAPGDDTNELPAFKLSNSQIAAVIGGALEQSLTDTFGEQFPPHTRTAFWRYFNHNLWNLIRSLRASNQLEKL